MKIYFVRHGESKQGANNLHQAQDSELSKKGREQAKLVGKRLKGINFDLILTSNFSRAKQTAEIINKTVKKEIRYFDFLNELKRPSVIEGKALNDPEIADIKKLLHEHFGNPDYKHSDEENFFDLKERAQQFLDYIANLKEKDKLEHLLVVSHGTLIKMIISIMMWNKELSLDEFLGVINMFEMTNTGVSIVEEGGNRGWRLITWNDITHLD